MITIGRYHIPLTVAIAWLLKAVLVFIFLGEIVSGDILPAIGVVVALFISLLPALISRNYRIHLPWVIDFAITGALFLHFFGVYYHLYHNVDWWWWDRLTHFIGTAVIGLLAFYITFTLDYTGKLRLTLPFVVITTITTALAIGAVWEIAEFHFDLIFGTHTVEGIEDTIHDLVFDTLGAGIVSILGVWYVHHFRQKHGTKTR